MSEGTGGTGGTRTFDAPSSASARSFRVPGVRALGRSFQAALEERRLIAALPFLAIAGLIVSRNLAADPYPVALMLVAVALTGAIALARHRIVMLRVTVAGMAFWIGFSLLTVHGTLFGTGMLAWPAYGDYTATVERVLDGGPVAQRVIVSDIVAGADARDLPIRSARLYLRDAPPLAAGDTITGAFRIAPVPSPITPGGYDPQFQAYFDGIGAYGSAIGPVTVEARGGESWRAIVDGLRHEIGRRIDAVLSPPESGIARALTVGDQSRISDETRETMATAGLAHVLAISGLHLTLVAGGVFALTRMGLALSYTLGQRFDLKKVAAVAGIVAALVYLTLSGASVSATRATIMLTLVFGAVLAGRRALTMRNVAIAAIALIVIDPASVFRPSFQLSFSAVAALVGVYEMMRGRGELRTGLWARVWQFFWGLALTSLIAGAATALFAAYHFQQTAPLGVLGNLVALPLVAFVVLPAAFVAVLVMPLGLEPPFLHVMAWGTRRILDAAHVIAAWSADIAVSPLLTPVSLVIAFAALGWFAFLSNRWRFAGPGAALVLIALFGLDRPPDIMIADTSKAVAVRTSEGMALISGRAPSFATDAWSETYQMPIAKRLETLKCDGLGCIARSPAGFTVALVEQSPAFAEDCWMADVVITRDDAPMTCRRATQVIDSTDLESGGVHWLRWNAAAERFAIRPAITRTNRPWRLPR